jgi:hypothetical protein
MHGTVIEGVSCWVSGRYIAVIFEWSDEPCMKNVELTHLRTWLLVVLEKERHA